MVTEKKIVVSERELFDKIKMVVQNFKPEKTEIKIMPIIIIIALILNLFSSACILWLLRQYKIDIGDYVQLENLVSQTTRKLIIVEANYDALKRGIDQTEQRSIQTHSKVEGIENSTNAFGDHLVYNTNEILWLRRDYENRFGIIEKRK